MLWEVATRYNCWLQFCRRRTRPHSGSITYNIAEIATILEVDTRCSWCVACNVTDDNDSEDNTENTKTNNDYNNQLPSRAMPTEEKVDAPDKNKLIKIRCKFTCNHKTSFCLNRAFHLHLREAFLEKSYTTEDNVCLSICLSVHPSVWLSPQVTVVNVSP